MPTASSASDAISLLTRDHERVLQNFEEFRQLPDDDSTDERQDIVDQTCAELRVHTTVEEEYFYPALRDILSRDLPIEEALVEHEMAGQLISELEGMQAGDEQFDAKFIVLGEYIRHHVDEEQEKLFPLAKKSGLDLEAIGEDIRQRAEELRAEYGLPEPDEAGASQPGVRGGDQGGRRAGRQMRP